ncbi:MAG TPA: RnfH family protein [Burkholderiales bacterium]|jgi:putative ubiquitin-RnfH superfamily antitoxin RatB of RatAB toxin-antitoxin module|nr:RnfH family protein [Burkholderiales bacterium]
MRIEVVYALPDGHHIVELDLAAGATAADAVKASGIAARHREIDLSRLGIFGRRVAGDTRLAEGDRVEIYRPLALDPKEARRERARRSGARRRSGR